LEFCSAQVGFDEALAIADDPNVHVSQAGEGLRVYESWREALAEDPDLGVDVRMMVPVFYDVQREKMKVWAVLDYATKPLSACSTVHLHLHLICTKITGKVFVEAAHCTKSYGPSSNPRN